MASFHRPKNTSIEHNILKDREYLKEGQLTLFPLFSALERARKCFIRSKVLMLQYIVKAYFETLFVDPWLA